MFSNTIKMQTSYLVAGLFFSTTFIQCYPIANTESEPKPKITLKEESTLPNGTVVGKYSYIDQEGNPVHVRYFADDSGYGVELKSVKFLNASEPTPVIFPNDPLSPLPAEKESTTGPFNFNFPDEEPKVPNEFAKNEPKTNWSDEKGDSELRRELAKSKKCATTRVKIYYDGLNRKGRDINPYNDGMPKVCEQF